MYTKHHLYFKLRQRWHESFALFVSVTITDNKQVDKIGKGSKQLIIGLDFGAAFTKVVIGDKRVRYAVPFDVAANSSNHYLLPSILGINEGNSCTLVSSSDSTSDTASLKLPLLDNTYSENNLLSISAYLALVFRSSREWLLNRYTKRYGRYQIEWRVNVGLPLVDTADHKLTDVYNKLLHTAWVISVLPGAVTLNRVRQFMKADATAFDAFPAIYKAKIIDDEHIATLPAVAAQVYGCAHAHTESEGLHLLIDVGAGTFNIATFDCGESNTDDMACSLYASAAESIGVCYLLKRRYENLQLSDNEINLFKDIPDTHRFSQAHDLTDKEIKFADTLYSGDAAKQINKVLDETKELHCPDSVFWESGVPTVICGGGSHLEILENIQHSFENKPSPHKIQTISFAVPDDLMVENLPARSFDRLSVAYGLSFPVNQITHAFSKNTQNDAQFVKELP